MNFLAERLRTSNVCDIIAGMSASRDWTPTPSLVDALREEGATEAEVSDVLLHCISAGRSHDTPRLVYADFLHDQGEAERAEFVRVQVELARIEEYLSKPATYVGLGRREVLLPRERELFGDVWKWTPEPFCNVEWSINRQGTGTRHFMDQEDDSRIVDLDWSRGFISSIRLSWQEWLRLHERLYWNAKQEVECPKCGGSGEDSSHPARPDCQACFKTPGRIPRPPVIEVPCGCGSINLKELASRRGSIAAHVRKSRQSCDQCSDGTISQSIWATAQPGLERVELTTWPDGLIPPSSEVVRLSTNIPGEGAVFTRVKCPTCNGRGLEGRSTADGGFAEFCSACHGQPANEWTCEEKWPGLMFAMPQAES